MRLRLKDSLSIKLILPCHIRELKAQLCFELLCALWIIPIYCLRICGSLEWSSWTLRAIIESIKRSATLNVSSTVISAQEVEPVRLHQ